jgi:drug/metabolite transporter (DMT)-like permease
MSPIALGLVLLAALAHSLWNLLVARTHDTQMATAVALVTGIVFFAPAALWSWQLSVEAIPYVAVSAGLELVYFILLARAYRSAELSVVYPLARGSAPVLVLLVGGARSPLQVVGILLVAVGTLLVRGIGKRGRWLDIVAGLAIGACIAGYTLVDQRGVRFANPTSYLESVMLLPALLYTVFVLWHHSPRISWRTVRPDSVAAGVLMFGAYGLTLAALQLSPASAVSAVRETSVVIAVALARRFLHEAVGYVRLGGAVVVTAGVAAVALG